MSAHLLATNREGIFAVGDVRCGSVKRVAAAVGELDRGFSRSMPGSPASGVIPDQKAAAE